LLLIFNDSAHELLTDFRSLWFLGPVVAPVNQVVEIALKQSVLYDAVLFKFTLGKFFSECCADATVVLQNIPLIKL